MKVNLLEALTQVPDFRAKRGQRYPLWLLLLLVIMGTLSNCLGYHALEDFCRRHHEALVTTLQLPPTRFPSDSTFRRVMMGIDFTDLANIFNNWVYSSLTKGEQDWLGVDGKSIKATVSNYDQAYQDFINVVSVFSAQQGVPIALQQFHNKQGSEIAVVQNLLATLALEGVVFTLDSLHCQKKLYS
jgi:hypothetical protein